MKHFKFSFSSAVRVTAILLVMLFALSTVSCGRIINSHYKKAFEANKVSDLETVESVHITEAVEYTKAVEAIETSREAMAIPVETTVETAIVTTAETTVEATVETTVETSVEAIEVVTEAVNYIDGKCTHEHYFGEAVSLYAEHDVTLNEDEILHFRNERLVIAYGGLRLREEPKKGSTQVGLLPDGTIIQISAREDGWAYTYYDGVWGWCSMEYLFEPFYYPTAGGAPLAFGTVTNTSGTELFCGKRCYDKDVVSTRIPYSAKVEIYSDVDGGPDNEYYVSYKGTLYGTCKAEDIFIEKYNY